MKFDFRDLMSFGMFILAALWKAIHKAAKTTNCYCEGISKKPYVVNFR